MEINAIPGNQYQNFTLMTSVISAVDPCNGLEGLHGDQDPPQFGPKDLCDNR